MGVPDDVGYFDDEIYTVPHGAADEATAQLDTMISRLDSLLLARAEQHDQQLTLWEGPARDMWESDHSFSQLEVQDVLDQLQELKGAISDVIEGIQAHNERVPSAGGGSW